MAFKENRIFYAVEVIVFNAIMLFATPFVYVLAVQKRVSPQRPLWLPRFRLKLAIPYFLFPLCFLLKNRKQMLVLTKVFSVLFLYFFIQLFEPNAYDLRPIQLCLLVIAASHAAIILHVREFELQFLSFDKNLPLTLFSRFLKTLLMFFCLMLPEFIILIKGIGVQYQLLAYPQLLLFIMALLCLFYVVLLTDDMNMDQMIRTVFGIIAG
jgi:hypothetical protein